MNGLCYSPVFIFENCLKTRWQIEQALSIRAAFFSLALCPLGCWCFFCWCLWFFFGWHYFVWQIEQNMYGIYFSISFHFCHAQTEK